MAYQRIYDRWSTEWTFVADSDSDLTTISSENPDAPVGSWVIAGVSGSPANIYIKLPSGSYTLLVGSSS